MEPYYQNDGITLYCGDCREVIPQLTEQVSTVITDPPYGLEFMGKEWDAPWKKSEGYGEHNAGFNDINLRDKDGRQKYKLPKPSFIGGTNPTCKNCGGTKFGNDRKSRKKCQCDNPKFLNYLLPRLKAYQDWSQNWLELLLSASLPGTMLLSFGGTRTFHRLACAIEDAGWEIRDCLMWLYGSGFPKSLNIGNHVDGWEGYGTALKPAWEPIILAMKPLDGTFAQNAERHGVAGLWIDGGRVGVNDEKLSYSSSKKQGVTVFSTGTTEQHPSGRFPANLILDEAVIDAEWTRFFYCAKASRAERNAGCEGLPNVDGGHFAQDEWSRKNMGNCPDGDREPVKNNHPTVKPLSLMRYLCRLTRTPTGGLILDPFAGSGSTLIAAKLENRPAIGIEKEEQYCEITARRLEADKQIYINFNPTAP